MSFLGGSLIGPSLFFWYGRLAAITGALATKPGALGTFAKLGNGMPVRVLLDQSLFAPAFVGVFFGALATLEGRPSAIPDILARDWPGAVLANWQIWIPAQCLNFYFVPLKYQVLFANFVALGWNTYLSYISHRGFEETDTNDDGRISREEFVQAFGQSKADAKFDLVDSDGDGFISRREWREAHRTQPPW